jgi:hypothetical protein
MIDFFEYLNQKHEGSIIPRILRVTDESSLKSVLKNISQHKNILRCVLEEDPELLQVKDSFVELACVLCDTSKSYQDRKTAFVILRNFIWTEALNFGSFDRSSGEYRETIDPLMRIKKPEHSFFFSCPQSEGAYTAQQKLFKQIQEDASFLEEVIKAVYTEQKDTK